MALNADESIVAPSGSHPRELETITPPMILAELRKGVLGQDAALRFAAVAVYKHVTGRVAGNVLLIGNSGTGKTTLMNGIQRLYNVVPEYKGFRSMTILNANLLVDPERLEFRPERLFAAIEQRARVVEGEGATPTQIIRAMERATVCIDEIDKMSTIIGGKPNPIGVALQQGLLTLMERNVVPYRMRVGDGDAAHLEAVEIDTAGMMFVCAGAFEELYEQVWRRVTTPGSGEKLRSVATCGADGQVRIDTRFALADFFKVEDLFDYGMVPQFTARFASIVLLSDLSVAVLKEILLNADDSPFLRSRQFFEVMGIDLEMDDLAAAFIAEQAEKHSRTGARALRAIFSTIINPFEFDAEADDVIEQRPDGRRRLHVTADLVRSTLKI